MISVWNICIMYVCSCFFHTNIFYLFRLGVLVFKQHSNSFIRESFIPFTKKSMNDFWSWNTILESFHYFIRYRQFVMIEDIMTLTLNQFKNDSFHSFIGERFPLHFICLCSVIYSLSWIGSDFLLCFESFFSHFEHLDYYLSDIKHDLWDTLNTIKWILFPSNQNCSWNIETVINVISVKCFWFQFLTFLSHDFCLFRL